MNLVCGKITTRSVLASVRRAAAELEGVSGVISLEDRREFMGAYNSLMLIAESHLEDGEGST
jgi:hypothetical protein